MSPLTRIEIAALIAVVRLEADAYGVAIREDIEGFLGRPVSMATLSAPLAVQGGRARRLYDTTGAGRTCLRHEQGDAARLWQALPARFSRSGR